MMSIDLIFDTIWQLVYKEASILINLIATASDVVSEVKTELYYLERIYMLLFIICILVVAVISSCLFRRMFKNIIGKGD